MDFIVLALAMVLSVGLSAVAARVVLELVLQALWLSVEQPQVGSTWAPASAGAAADPTWTPASAGAVSQ